MKKTVRRLVILAAVIASTASLNLSSVQMMDGVPIPTCPACPPPPK